MVTYLQQHLDPVVIKAIFAIVTIILKRVIYQQQITTNNKQNRQVFFAKTKTNVGNFPLSRWKTVEILKIVRFQSLNFTSKPKGYYTRRKQRLKMICYAREALKNQLNIELDFTHSIARVLLTFILRTGFRQILLVTPHNTQKRRRRRRRKKNKVGTDDIRGSLLIQFLTQPDRAF